MSDWWSKDPLVQAGTRAAQVVANPEQWWANDPEAANQPGMVSSAVRGAAQGFTLGAGDELSAAAATSIIPGAADRARVLPLPDPVDLLGAGARGILRLVAPSWIESGGATYDRALEQKRADNRQHQKANPISYGAGEVVGGAVPVVAAASAAPAAFGVTGTLGMRSAMSAASGGVTGAVQGFNSGEGGVLPRAEEAAKGFLGGAAIGAVAPTAGMLTGKAYRGIVDALVDRTAKVPGVSNPAVRIVADALLADEAVNPTFRSNVAKLGPEGMLLDAGDSVKGLAQGVALRPGEARARVVKALTERRGGTDARIGADLNGALGPAVVPSQVESGLAAGREALGEAYGQVFRNARAVDTTALANQLDTMAIDLRGDPRRAVLRAREMLNIPGNAMQLDPSPRALFNTRQALDGLIESEKDSKVLSQLGFARQAVDDYLRAAVPGIKEVDARFQELARQSEGLTRGASVLDSGKTAIRPAEMASAISAGAEPAGLFVGPSGETFRLRQGVRGEIDRLVGTKSNDYLAVRDAVKGDGDWNRAKLVQLFGEERADRVVNALDREAAFRQAYDHIVQGSQTKMRDAAEKLVAIRDGKSGDGAGIGAIVGTVGGPTGLAAQAGIKGANAVKGVMNRTADEARNAEIAKLLIARGDEMAPILDVLSRNARGRAASERGGAAVERVVQALLMSRGYDAGSAGAPYAQRVARSALR